MHTTPAQSTTTTRPSGRRVGRHAEHAVQRVADASIWLLFRLNRVES